MPKGKTSKPAAGQTVRVNEGVCMPEFDDLSIAGWTGVVMSTGGSGAKQTVTLEWDADTQAKIPESYLKHCESQHLLASMACLPGRDVSPVEN